MKTKANICIYRYTSINNSRHIRTLANHLVSEGFGVTIVCAESDGSRIPGYDNKILIVGLNTAVVNGKRNAAKKIINQVQVGMKLKRALAGDHDMIYVIDSWSLPSFYLATSERMKVKNLPLIYHTFDWIEPSLVRKMNVMLEKKICRTADLVVNVDRSRARMMRTMYDLDTTPLAIPNYLSINDEIPPADQSFRKKVIGQSPSGDEKIVIYPTVISNKASAERMAFELISAMKSLPEQYYLAVFSAEGEESRRCRKLVEDNKLNDRVKFFEPVDYRALLGNVAASDLGAVFYDDSASSGYFMCNSDKLAIFTAVGIPVVASDYPNLESLIYKYGLGESCDSKDPESIAGAIRILSEGEEPILQRKQNIRKVYAKRLNYEANAGELTLRLHKIISGSD